MSGMTSATPDLRLPSRDQYKIILLGYKGTRMWTTCARLLPDSGMAGIQTRKCWVAEQV